MRLELLGMLRYIARGLARVVGLAPEGPVVAHADLEHMHWDRDLRSWMTHGQDEERAEAA